MLVKVVLLHSENVMGSDNEIFIVRVCRHPNNIRQYEKRRRGTRRRGGGYLKGEQQQTAA